MKHEPIKVTPHLFQLGTNSFPAYLSVGEECMIIEGGTGPTSDIIVSQVESLGISPEKIRYMALTHTHADHIGAIPRLKKIWTNIQILGSPIAAKFLKRENLVKKFLASDKMISRILLEKGDIDNMPADLEEYDFKADGIIDEGDRIDLGGGIQWEVFCTPGHSPCHLSFYEETEKSLAIGDTTGYFDPERDLFWPNYFQSLEVYCDSIKKLSSIPAERLLLSHNGVIQTDAKKYMEKAMKATEECHIDLIKKLDMGYDKEAICEEKTDWIFSIGALATRKVISFLWGLLIKNSLKEDERGLFGPSKAEAA